MSQHKLQIKLTRRGELVRDTLQALVGAGAIYVLLVLACVVGAN